MAEPITPDIAEGRRLLAEATARPWVWDNGDGYGSTTVWSHCSPSGHGAAGRMVADMVGDDAETDPNAELIVYAVNNLDALLALATEAETYRARADAAEARLAEADRVIAPFKRFAERLQGLVLTTGGKELRDHTCVVHIGSEGAEARLEWSPFRAAASWRSTGGEGGGASGTDRGSSSATPPEKGFRPDRESMARIISPSAFAVIKRGEKRPRGEGETTGSFKYADREGARQAALAKADEINALPVADPVGAAEREVGRFIYTRIAKLMDAKPATPEGAELTYLARIVSDVEEYGADGTDPDAPVEFGGGSLTDAQVKHMVDRFLGWRFPADFNPDGGISFTRPNYAPEVDGRPSGTNLLCSTQAYAMVRYMADGIPPPTTATHAGEPAIGWRPGGQEPAPREFALLELTDGTNLSGTWSPGGEGSGLARGWWVGLFRVEPERVAFYFPKSARPTPPSSGGEG